jgi:metal-responsive CopG/Arc/MetJ family transcriptional regulator
MISDTKKRVQVTLSRDLLDELEHFSKGTGYSKSNFVEVALRQYFRKESNE